MSDRVPMDGNSTTDIGMMSVPIGFEHGDESSVPCLYFYVDIRIPYDVACSRWDEIEKWINENYSGGEPGVPTVVNWTEWTWCDALDDDRETARVEFSAGPYLEGETTEQWISRTVANTHFNKVYNHFVIMYTGEENLAEHLGIDWDEWEAS